MPRFELREHFAGRAPNNGRFFTVAIDGRGGCGKTQLARYLREPLADFTFLEGDDYFEPAGNATTWGDFNDARFVAEVIEPLATGSDFRLRPYDWEHQSVAEGQVIHVERGLCFERCYSFTFDLPWDLRIWVETPREVCLERGLARDNELDAAQVAWSEVWQPREDLYITTFNPAQVADVVIDGTADLAEQMV